MSKIKWKDADFKWNISPTDTTKPRYTWNDVVLVEEAVGDVGGGGVMVEDMPWTQWEDDKKKRLIKLICKVKGRTYKETKEVKEVKITAKDIKLLAEKVLGIEVITENIKF
tara:strand:+ start:4540 stop:4872 length:333 start_codon:yes stop_codon:yes gene_type:complete